MIREAVKSTNVAALAYDPVAWCLEVEFAPKKNGERDIWNYFGIPASVYETLMAAPSIGSAFVSVKNAYSGRKVATIREDGIEVEA